MKVCTMVFIIMPYLKQKDQPTGRSQVSNARGGETVSVPDGLLAYHTTDGHRRNTH